MPGAINIFWKANLDENDVWRDADELRRMFEKAGVTRDKEIVVCCQGGNHNGQTYVTLKALGYPLVRSYDRAWPEWSSDRSLPTVGTSGNSVEVVAPQRLIAEGGRFLDSRGFKVAVAAERDPGRTAERIDHAGRGASRPVSCFRWDERVNIE